MGTHKFLGEQDSERDILYNRGISTENIMKGCLYTKTLKCTYVYLETYVQTF